MNRGVSVVLVLIGLAWLLTGVGTMIGQSEARALRSEMAAEMLADVEESLDARIESEKARIDKVTKRYDKKIERAQAKVDKRKEAVDKVTARFADALEDKADERDAAMGNRRRVKRVDQAIARIERRRDSQLSRPAAALKDATEALAAAEAAKKEALEAVQIEIGLAETQKAEAIAEAKNASSDAPNGAWWKPLIAVLIGVLFIGGGVALGLISSKPAAVARFESSPAPMPRPRAVDVSEAEAMVPQGPMGEGATILEVPRGLPPIDDDEVTLMPPEAPPRELARSSEMAQPESSRPSEPPPPPAMNVEQADDAIVTIDTPRTLAHRETDVLPRARETDGLPQARVNGEVSDILAPNSPF